MTTQKATTIALAAALAVLVSIFAIVQQHRTVSITRGAEDDCPYTYGSRALADVQGFDQGAIHAVRCIYN